ncbi:nuclear factor of activated T-cells, cytoplasmic 4 [Stigmatopora nigra]
MGAAPGSGWEEGEFEFKLVFEEDAPRPEDEGSGLVEPTDSSGSSSADGHSATTSVELSLVGIPSSSPLANQRAGMHSPPPRRAPVREFMGTYESLPARSVQVSESRVVECPSIQITTISPEDGLTAAVSWDGEGSARWDRERLYLPLLDPFNYRDRSTGSLSPSPASSPSSRGWLSPASSCDSLLVEEEELNEATLHFGISPSSRPTSPGGKKRRNSPLASPCSSRRGSFSDEQPGPDGRDCGLPSQTSPDNCELSVPQKTRKTSVEQLSPRDQKQGAGQQQPENPQTKRDPTATSMNYLSVPTALVWGRTRASTHSPLFRTNALPPLDWPLPSQFDQYELRIEVQPRPHHRAHYETEGSRGAVKSAPTGHPVIKLFGYNERKPLSLQVFVGTADDRSIRPHPFYQIHRVTGKMVGTTSHESIQAGTKVLDIPLSPENHMTALIDCAGILKLRNSDIELRKGETDVGRKNTRVRLIFRTHLALAPPGAPTGRVLALQVASLPIECSQRSAQELPVIESVSLTSSSVEGGEELLLSGTNFVAISRVLFIERSTDGKLQWEEEAQVDRDNSNECLLCVRVPQYSDLSITHPVSVSLYVSNGKRKRSSTHCFKYVPIMFKDEDPLLPPLAGGAPRSSMGSQPSIDMTVTDEKTGMAFSLPPYPSTYSPPCTAVAYPEEYGADKLAENTSGTCPPTVSEHQSSFENLELGFTELLPPLYLRGPQPPSPCPWLDSPYLSSSPSPSHSSSLSPFAAGSPISSSPLPPLPNPPFPQYCAYPQEISPSPPTQLSVYPDVCSAPYSHYESWDPPAGVLGANHGELRDATLDFTTSNTMHQITFEEVSEYIGQDMQSYQASPHVDKQPH